MSTVIPPNTSPNVQGSDTLVVGGPRPLDIAQNFTGTLGTGGVMTFGTYHGSPIPEPHRIYKWDIKLPTLTSTPGVVGPSIVNTPIVQSIDLGFDATAPTPHAIGGRPRNIADLYNTNEMRLVFYNDEDQTPIWYIRSWHSLIRIFNTTGEGAGLDNGLYQYPVTYMKNIQIFLQDQKSKTRMTITLIDCFPSQTGIMKLDYKPIDRTEIMQEFIVNRIKVESTPAGNQLAMPPMPGTPSQTGGKIFGIQTLQP
jgi:hypothetical protein